MTYAGHFRAILVLGLPLIGGHLAQFAIGLTDTVMLGWYGVEQLAAITLAGTFFFVFFLMGSGFAWAVMPLVATYAAEGNETAVRRSTRMGVWLSLLFAALVIPVFWWSKGFLILLGQSPELAADAATYLRVAGWGIVPALMVMALKSFLAAVERTQIVLWITVLAAVMNGLANYALIFGNWGLPELGLVGAAIASVLTQIVSLVGVIVYVAVVLPRYHMFQRLWRPDWEMLSRVFRLGVPIGLTALSEVTLFAASAMMMGWLGTVPLAAHGIAVQLASAMFMVHLGLGNVATVRAGNALGRGDRQHMARGAIVVTAMSMGVALTSVALFLLFPELLISAFLEAGDTDRSQIIGIGVGLLAVAALFQLVDGAQVIALSLLRGVQDTGAPMLIAALSYWAVGVPTSYILGFVAGMGGIGIWLGLVTGLACAGVLLMWRFWGFGLNQVGPPPDDAAQGAG